MTDEREIHIHNNTTMDANAHIFTVIGTVLAIGGVGMLAWALSNAGMLDLAATGLTMFGFQLVSMMMKVGLIVLPERTDGSFAETSGHLKTFLREFHEWQARSPIWRLAAMALAYTIGFLIVRWGLSVGLGIFANIWVAGASAAIVASIIVAPRLFSNIFHAMKTKSGVQIKTTTDKGQEAA
ncbi:hypothetical protein QYM46_13660 [Brevibacterium sp. K11IcPPYGO002]|uniref:hypothetical protein n=1 Tax=Brevibacterium sp. K11IcPPYGO002 TaxID=3058837 RepID=UPI003D819C6D